MPATYSPTRENFLQRARTEFGFLVAEFDFREQPLPGFREVNPFQVRYANKTTLVEVEGTSWGYGVQVMLGENNRPLFASENVFPLWPIVKLRNPELYGQLAVGDQLAQLSAWANALKECASEVLRGDFAVRPQVRRLLEDAAKNQPSELEEWLFSKAVSEANEAFRAKEFARVVDLLAPQEPRLSPALRLKLEHARKKCNRMHIIP